MGTARVRRNVSVANFHTVSHLHDGSGAVLSTHEDDLNLYDYSYCEDELNEMQLMGTYPYDVGGKLLSMSIRHDFPSFTDHAIADKFGIRWDCHGPIIASPVAALTSPQPDTWITGQSSFLDSIVTRVGLGATAISRCRPAKPQASLAVSFAEAIREGIPASLKQVSHIKDEVAKFRDLSKSSKARTVPGKYLEWQFGWKPLQNDIQNVARSLLNQQAILDDLRRNSKKRMRRRYSFPAVTVYDTEYLRDWTGPWPGPNAYVLQQAGQRVVRQVATKKTWFAGEFVYTFPGVDASLPSQMLHGARQLLGVDLSPETVWNVMPWTWLADWNANVGDVLANISAIGLDDLILRYGYLMQEAEQKNTHTHTGITIGEQGIPRDLVGTSTVRAKSRIVASPFGFGLATEDFTPRQIAILASIGLTRGKR
jgi:hypothetical protein